MKRRRTPVWLLAFLAASPLAAQKAAQPEPALLSRELNRELPTWLRIGAEERVRVESLSGVGFRAVTATGFAVMQLLGINGVPPPYWRSPVAETPMF